MECRQASIARQWLIVDARSAGRLWAAVGKLPKGSGVLVLHHGLPRRQRHRILVRLNRAAKTRGLVVVDEAAGEAARVHNVRELRRALLARTPLILLSPIYRTRSHPDWRPMPRMRAAAFARLTGRNLIALGGMDERRFRRIQRLGFVGWAGIDAWI